jgi:hypothetical protein
MSTRIVSDPPSRNEERGGPNDRHGGVPVPHPSPAGRGTCRQKLTGRQLVTSTPQCASSQRNRAGPSALRNMGSNRRSGLPLTARRDSTPVLVNLDALFPHAGASSGKFEGLELQGWAIGALERWLRSTSGQWIGVVTVYIQQSDGSSYRAGEGHRRPERTAPERKRYGGDHHRCFGTNDRYGWRHHGVGGSHHGASTSSASVTRGRLIVVDHPCPSGAAARCDAPFGTVTP